MSARLLDFAARLERSSPLRKNKDGIGFTACCPAHRDRSPSLLVTEKSDGVILVNCFAGCGAGEILSEIGLEFSDLYPKNLTRGGSKSMPRHNYKNLCDVAYQACIESVLLMRSGLPVDEIGVLLMENAAKVDRVANEFRSASYE